MTTENLPSLAAVIEALPNPLLVLDSANRVCMANAASEDFFQAGASVLTRLGIAELAPFSSPVLQSVEQVRQSGSVVIEYGMGIGTPRFGGERSVDLQTAPVGDGTGHVMILLLRRSMAQKLGQQLSHLGAARSVTAMASMLAHEIKNPLAGIKGAAQLIEPGLSEEDRSMARLIQDEAERIRKLVDQLEVFTDERPLDRRPVNIHVVLDRVKKLVVAENNDIVFLEEYDPSLPFVLGNNDQLVQVFLNLAKNAVDAVRQVEGRREIMFSSAFRPGVKLQVAGSTERVSLPLEVCVHDNGPGIPEDIQPHIFDPFVTTKRQGRGLGLALVAKVVRDHGGTVECQPRRRGTTFRCLLPMIREEERRLPTAVGGQRQ
jgi:two-component system, NtrC family, nitrogen regulation sensor histidine kinase GlnL